MFLGAVMCAVFSETAACVHKKQVCGRGGVYSEMHWMLTSESERSFPGSANSLPWCWVVQELPRVIAFFMCL